MNDGIIPIYGGADSTDVDVDSLSTDSLAAPAAPDEPAKKGEPKKSEPIKSDEHEAEETPKEAAAEEAAAEEAAAEEESEELKNSAESAKDNNKNNPGKYWTIQIGIGKVGEGNIQKLNRTDFTQTWHDSIDGKEKHYYGCFRTYGDAEVALKKVQPIIEDAWIPGHSQKPDECKLQNQSISQDNLNDAKDPNELSVISGSKTNSNGSDKQNAVPGTTDDSNDSQNEMGLISAQSPANNETEDSGSEGSEGPNVPDESNEQLDSNKREPTPDFTYQGK